MKQDDTVDPGVGFWFRKKVGDRVRRGEVVAEVLANDPKLGKRITGELGDCLSVGAKKPRASPLIVERIGVPLGGMRPVRPGFQSAKCKMQSAKWVADSGKRKAE